MADIIREQFKLLTLRCSVDQRYANDEPHRQFVALCQLYQGDTALGPETRTELSQLGLGSALRPELYREPFPRLEGTAIAAQLLMAKSLLDPASAPLWLHIARDAYQLAALPWEELIVAITGLRVLRVPNFLVDPCAPATSPTIAICASAPRAKTEIVDTERGVLDILEALNHAFEFNATKPTVHIFADSGLPDRLGPAISSQSASPRFKHLKVVFPNYPATPTAPMSQSSPAGGIDSPWLRWMAESLRGQVVDVVHFVCPGYFQERNGAIALAETPLSNPEKDWARFVGARELTALFNRLGCNVAGFSSIATEPSNIGLRLLAFQLSWLRAGPIFVTDSRDPFEATQAIFELLLRVGQSGRVAPSRAQLSCHPEALAQRLPGAHLTGTIDESLLAIAQGTRSKRYAMPDLKINPGASLEAREKLTSAPVSAQYLSNLRAQLTDIDVRSDFEKLELEGSARALSFLEGVLKQSS